MIKAVRIGFVIAAGLLLGLLPSPAHAEESGLSLDISASKSQYAPGEPIELKFTVTNRGPTPCQVATVPDGALHLTSVTRDGSPVPRLTEQVSYINGYGGKLRDGLATVPQNGISEFTVVAVADDDADKSVPLHTISPLPGDDGLAIAWQLSGSGRYEVKAGYSVPRVKGDGPAPCAGTTGIATVSFAVGDTSGFPWLWVIIGAVAVVIVAVVVVVLIRRGRRRTTVAAVAILTLVGAVGTNLTTPTPAEARVAVYPNGIADFQAAIDTCFGSFAAPGGDPAGIMGWINDPNQIPVVRILPTDQGSETFGPVDRRHIGDPNEPPPEKGTSSTIKWDWRNREPFVTDPGVNLDPCAELYHEFVHAHDIGQGTIDNGKCRHPGMQPGENEPVIRETKATLWENVYRANRGLPQRNNYDGRRLPTGPDPKSALEQCKPPPPPEPRRGGGCSISHVGRLAGRPMLDLSPGSNGRTRSYLAQQAGKCGQSNGDPHLGTVDGYDYDFQAVGEFVAAKAGELEMQTRQSPVPHLRDRTVSVNSAVAIRVGADRIGFYVENGEIAVHLNGQLEALPQGDKKLPGGGTITRGPGAQEYGPDGYTVAWPDGSTADVDIIGTWGIRLYVAPADKHKGQLTGLLGNFDGNKDNELVARDGKPVSQPPHFEQLYRTYGDSWRVAQAESLFDYAPGESTDTFTDRSFPERERTVKDLPEDQRASAEAACRAVGVTDPTLLDQCILDIALTGQPAFAVNAGDTQSIRPEASEPAPGPVQPGGTVRDGDTVKGKLDAPGERDVYQMDLGEATEFQFVDLTGDISIEPEGAGLWRRALAVDPWRLADSSPEAKRLVVSAADNATVEYSFRVVTQKHRRFDVKMGDRIGRGGVPGTGRLDVPGRVDIYVLDAGPAGSIELTESQGCDYWVGIAEDVPGATVPTPYPMWPDQPGGPCLTIPIHVEANTRFQLVVWSAEARTLDYGFRIQAR